MLAKTTGNKFWLRLKQSEGSESRDLAKWLQGLSPESLGEDVPDSKDAKSLKDDFASLTVEYQGEISVAAQFAAGMENENAQRERGGKEAM